MKVLDPTAHPAVAVLVVAPHPDDEAIGAGGTVRRFVEAGARVGVVVVADGAGGVGADGAAPDERRAECELSCRILGTAPPWFAGLPSAALRDDPLGAARRIADLGGRGRWDVVLVPSPLERHATHRAALLAALASGALREGGTLLGYGAWDAIPAGEDTFEVDITSTRAAKTRAIAAHRSQERARPLGAGITARDMSQAVFSSLTGDESRRAVERLLDLGGLVEALDAEGGMTMERLAERVGSWTAERARSWAASLWA